MLHARVVVDSTVGMAAPPPPPRAPTFAEQLLLGAAAASAAVVVTNPVEVAKTRLQRPLSPGGAATASVRAVLRELHAEAGGPRWAAYGLHPALWRATTYGAVRLGLYEPTKAALVSAPGGPSAAGVPSASLKLFAGLLSGVAGSVVGTPFDVVKVRSQALPPTPPSPPSASVRACARNGTWAALATLARTEGIAALWTGVGPSAARSAVLTASQVGVYDEVKAELKRAARRRIDSAATPPVGACLTERVAAALAEEGVALRTTTALLAGVVTTTATNPFDVVKTRLMCMRGDRRTSEPLPSALSLAARMVREEGPWSLLRGWVPAWARLGPNSLVVMLVFDGARGLLGLSNL